MSLRRATPKSRAFIERGRRSAAASLQESSRRSARAAAKRRARKPQLTFNPYAARCELAKHDPSGGACRGLIQRCHLIPWQRLERMGYTVEEAWSEDFWILGCEHHHHDRLDKGYIRLSRSDLPAGLEHRARKDPQVEIYLDLNYGDRPKMKAAA